MEFCQPFQGDYPITLDYGEKFPPLYTDESPHRGIDYGCPSGTPILASEDGVVIDVHDFGDVGYGKYVLISHDKGAYQTAYAHLSEIKVGKFEPVGKGQVIGLSGTTGNSTGPHLHFEVRKNNIKIDPKTVLHNVFDTDPNIYTPTPEKPQFEAVESGFCKVVCDIANVRCHCDMNRVVGTLEKGDIIAIGDETTIWNGLPYRDYYDPRFHCWLRVAEHDPTTQMIVNTDVIHE